MKKSRTALLVCSLALFSAASLSISSSMLGNIYFDGIYTGGSTQLVKIEPMGAPAEHLTALELAAGKGRLLDVEENNVNWNELTELNIFSRSSGVVDDGVIAPGTCGSYHFTLENATDYKVDYRIDVSDNNGEKIPVEYRLRTAANYLVGDEQSWISANDGSILNYSSTFRRRASGEMILDWRWLYEDGRNTQDTALGNIAVDGDLIYKVTLNVSAQISPSEISDANTPDTGVEPMKKTVWIILAISAAILIISAVFLIASAVKEKKEDDDENSGDDE